MNQIKIGSGTYSEVYKAICPKTNRQVAIKKLTEVYSTRDKIYNKDMYINEIEILKHLDHVNIIKLFEYSVSLKGVHLTFEYCEMTLTHMIQKLCTSKYPTTAKSIMTQVLAGINYFHSKNIIHRDLKPCNIMLIHGIVKIIDFGLSCDNDDIKETGVQTVWYRAPEVVLKNTYSFPIDIWSYGCIFMEVICDGKVLFHTDDERVLLQKIQRLNLPFLHEQFKYSDEVQEIIEKCLIIDPKKRSTAPQLYELNYFK